MKGSILKWLLVAIVVALVVRNLDKTKEILGQCYTLVMGGHSTAAAAPADAGNPSASSASPDAGQSAQIGQAQSAVEVYMHANAAPGCTLAFLDWSDFSNSGPASIITLHYRVQQPSRQDVVARVRFTVQGGSVAKAEIVAPGSRAPNVPVALVTPPPVVIDRFSEPIMAAEHGPAMTLHLSDAFGLSQLEQAKAEARAQRKPLGFLMVWGKIFDQEADTRGKDSESALVHFYQVFNDHLVLVFVRHETELGQVPPAVRQGFSGPDEGGFAPNMAVTDASATEFIVEIPYRALDGAGRDQLFAAGGAKIDQWLATHPDALARPGP